MSYPEDSGQPAARSDEQATRARQRRGCLWFFIFAAILLLVALIALWLIIMALAAKKGGEPYRIALTAVQDDAQVKQRLGEPIRSASWLPQGSINVSDDRGDANLTFRVQGPKGKATVNALARRIGGQWGLTSLTVTYPDGEREVIDVSGAGGSELEAPRWQPAGEPPAGPAPGPSSQEGASSAEEAAPAGEIPESTPATEAAPPSLELKIPEVPQK